jgi:hypothetical protein
MLFRITLNNSAMNQMLATRNILIAKNMILLYPFGASERILDTYLRQNFKLGLRECCLTILFKLNRSSSGNEVLYTLTEDYWDTIAQLITCGVGEIPGSRILLDSICGVFK